MAAETVRVTVTSISTIGGLIYHDMRLDAWCPKCSHGRKVDLEELARIWGEATTYIKPASPITIRCPKQGCGGLMDYTIAAR